MHGDVVMLNLSLQHGYSFRRKSGVRSGGLPGENSEINRRQKTYATVRVSQSVGAKLLFDYSFTD